MKWIVLGAVIFTAFFNLLSGIFHIQGKKNPIPDSVKDVYDEEQYKKWRAYQAANQKLFFIKEIVSFVITFCLLFFNVYAAFAGLFGENVYLQILAVVLFDTIVSMVVGLPFDIFDTFVIEEKFGFNRSTKATFIADQIKNLIIGFVLSYAIAAILALIYSWIGAWVVLGFAIVLVIFSLFVSFFSPYLAKIFNKFTDLEDGELKEKLTALLTKNGYQVRKICVMDASKRSTKSNAYFTGFGKLKTIVLYDTLVASMTPDQICAVFAHELGHGLHKDVQKMQVMSIFNSCLMAVILGLILAFDGFMKEFGFADFNYAFAVILIGHLYGFINPLMQIIINAYSRKAEYRADHQAVEEGYGKDLQSALKTLAKENLADLAPSKATVVLEYSHPPISARIEAIEKDLK